MSSVIVSKKKNFNTRTPTTDNNHHRERALVYLLFVSLCLLLSLSLSLSLSLALIIIIKPPNRIFRFRRPSTFFPFRVYCDTLKSTAFDFFFSRLLDRRGRNLYARVQYII